jgi:hypothetical protein
MEEGDIVDYVIRNKYGNLFIRLDENGRPVTCCDKDKALMEYCKAKNIVKSLPKNLRKFGFSVEGVPEIKTPADKKAEQGKEASPRVIQNNDYSPSSNVTRWIERFSGYEKDIKDAEKRGSELNSELSNVDKELTNILHEIEISSKCNMYQAWIIVNTIRTNRRKRRDIKDEKLMVDYILALKVKDFRFDNFNKVIEMLKHRKFVYRIVEEGDDTDGD